MSDGVGAYSLGVDLGTTFVAAAVARGPRVEMFTLGDRTVVTPAVVYARDDGSLVTGEAANRRAVSSPDRVGREFKRRLGDPTPVMLGGAPHAVTSLLAALLARHRREGHRDRGRPAGERRAHPPGQLGPLPARAVRGGPAARGRPAGPDDHRAGGGRRPLRGGPPPRRRRHRGRLRPRRRHLRRHRAAQARRRHRHPRQPRGHRAARRRRLRRRHPRPHQLQLRRRAEPSST